jgi:hypothetical protein
MDGMNELFQLGYLCYDETMQIADVKFLFSTFAQVETCIGILKKKQLSAPCRMGYIGALLLRIASISCPGNVKMAGYIPTAIQICWKSSD